jgi:hypothetical protein
LAESTILSVEQASGENIDKYMKIVELTTLPTSNPTEDALFSRLILDKLNTASEQLGLVREEDDTDRGITQVGTW